MTTLSDVVLTLRSAQPCFLFVNPTITVTKQTVKPITETWKPYDLYVCNTRINIGSWQDEVRRDPYGQTRSYQRLLLTLEIVSAQRGASQSRVEPGGFFGSSTITVVCYEPIAADSMPVLTWHVDELDLTTFLRKLRGMRIKNRVFQPLLDRVAEAIPETADFITELTPCLSRCE